MKTLISVAAVLAAVGMVAGCFTSATAYTEKTNPDGTKTVSRVNVVGTGDKASQVAAEGLFADGTQEDLGAGVKTASATQQSTGVKETLEGMAVLLTGVGNLVNRAQDIPIASSAVSSATANADTLEASSETVAATSGYGGIPGTDGIGVYGQPTCSRCRAYKTAHPETEIIDVRVAANEAALRSALKRLGHTGSIPLPVEITVTGYTLSAK